eukprot:6278518-Pyramimonas_sp.AAC.1
MAAFRPLGSRTPSAQILIRSALARFARRASSESRFWIRRSRCSPCGAGSSGGQASGKARRTVGRSL